MKKKISLTVDEELDAKLIMKCKQIGISKSSFVAFATSFFMHQLEYAEQFDDGVYQLIKENYELQQEIKENKHK